MIDRRALLTATAALAGVAAGVLDPADLARGLATERRFEPAMPVSERGRLYAGWQRAVACARQWTAPADPAQAANQPRTSTPRQNAT